MGRTHTAAVLRQSIHQHELTGEMHCLQTTTCAALTCAVTHAAQYQPFVQVTAALSAHPVSFDSQHVAREAWCPTG